jgi:tetratricopeptide (TPR) repeat protein
MNPSNDNFLAVYVNFCLRHKKFDNAESLLERLLRINDSLENRTIYGILMLRRRRYKEAMAVFRGLIEDATANNQQKTIYNQLAAMTLRKQGDVKQSEKFKTMA